MPTAIAHAPPFTVPGSSTSTALVRWSGTGGNQIQDSTILVGATTMGLAADTDLITFGNATLAITGAVTGVTALTVDNLNFNGNTLTANSGAVNITPAAGSAIVLDGAVNVDAGVVTGATSITSTQFVGGGVGLTGLAAANITASGTLPALNGAALTALNGTQVTSGTVPVAQLGSSGSRSSSTFLNGANAWAAAGGGAMTLISSTTVSTNVGQVDFTGLSGYTTYFLQVSNAVPTADGPYAWLLVGDSSGFDTANLEYSWVFYGIHAHPSSSPIHTAYVGSTNSSETSSILLFRRGVGSDTGEGFSAALWIHTGTSGQRTRVHGTVAATTYLNESAGGLVAGERTTNITMDRIRFTFSSGNIEAGTISLYGVSNA